MKTAPAVVPAPIEGDMPRYTLLLTLGHNASAIAIDEESGHQIGYEEERLSGKKSDSSFPALAIQEIGKHIPLKSIELYFVSHWFDAFDVRVAQKYWDPARLHALCPNAVRVSPYVTSPDGADVVPMSHHDGHAYSALAFTEHYADVDETWHVMVVDGFGTREEVMSIYQCKDPDSVEPGAEELTLIHRSYGYNHSLGLMFQYAAEYCGMHGFDDVYKFLGYQAQVTPDDTTVWHDILVDHADRFVKKEIELLLRCKHPELPESHNPLQWINHGRLGAARDRWMDLFQDVQDAETVTVEVLRARIGFFVQRVLERTLAGIVEHFGITNMMAAGGCFYNVKLNGYLLNHVKRLSVMPLAGDQGAAIGLYRRCKGPWSWAPNLATGIRRPVPLSADNPDLPQGMFVLSRFSKCANIVVKHLQAGAIVNIVRPTMEFGPRALCYTPTLALATMENVKAINAFNGRNTIMPMAPVMTRASAFYKVFDSKELNRTIGTDEFMVCAHPVNPDLVESMQGATLREQGHHTARPQLVSNDDTMTEILTSIDAPCLINTSFNGHGSPIVFTLQDVIDLHNAWLEKQRPEYFITLYFISE